MRKKYTLEHLEAYYEVKDIDTINLLSEVFEVSGEKGRNELLIRVLLNDKDSTKEDLIKKFAIQITHYIFRNGIIEDLHAGKFNFENYENIPPNTPIEQISQLTQSDMKALNKFLVDRIGYMLHLFIDSSYSKLSDVVNTYEHYGNHWDSPNLDIIEENTKKNMQAKLDLINTIPKKKS